MAGCAAIVLGAGFHGEELERAGDAYEHGGIEPDLIAAVDGPFKAIDPRFSSVYSTPGFVGWPILLNVVLDVTLPQDYDHVVVSIAGWTPPKGTWLKDAIELIEEEDDVAVVTLGVPDEWQTKRGVMPVESRGYWIVPRVWDGFVARREHLEMWRAVPYLPVYGDVFGDFSEYNHGHGVVLRPGNWDNPPLDLKFPESATTMSLDGGLFRD